jgi:hypothetical protein
MKRRTVALLSGLVILSALACNVLAPAPADPPTAPPETATPEDQPLPTLPPSPVPAATQTPAPEPPAKAPPAPTGLNVPLRIHNPLEVARTDEPVTSGVPLPRDLALTDPGHLRLVDSAGNPVPAQFTVLARWGGSADDDAAPMRWVLVDFQATVGPQDTAYYFLQEGGPGPAPAHALVVTDGADALTIDTGAGQWSISKADGDLDGPGLGGPIFAQVLSATTYETAGPVTVRVALEGPIRCWSIPAATGSPPASPRSASFTPSRTTPPAPWSSMANWTATTSAPAAASRSAISPSSSPPTWGATSPTTRAERASRSADH